MAKYIPGKYEGIGEGYHDDVVAWVEVSEDRIEYIDYEEHETPEVGGLAIERLVGQMLQDQTADIDAVSGASYASAGIIEAVNHALDQAQGLEPVRIIDEAPIQLADRDNSPLINLGRGKLTVKQIDAVLAQIPYGVEIYSKTGHFLYSNGQNEEPIEVDQEVIDQLLALPNQEVADYGDLLYTVLRSPEGTVVGVMVQEQFELY